ncbi:MAG TPA: hypothetical protein VGC71_05500 [Gaiellales bacterium]
MSDEGRVWDCALRVRDLLLAHAAQELRALCDPGFWDRSGETELGTLAAHATAVEMLGVLGHRSLLLAETPGAPEPRYAVEQQWTTGDAGNLAVEDERLFTLADRSAAEASGDAERLARLGTKLAAQDAAARYAELLQAGDAAGAAAMWTDAFREAHGAHVVPRIGSVRAARLIAGVGPRTLVRCWFDEGEETVELLWRETDRGRLIHGARTFRPPA